MSAAASPSEHQRAHGDLHVTMKLREGRTVLDDLRQQGCLKARFPRPPGWAEVVTLNTSGGVAGGDTLRTTLRVRHGASASFAAQAAERFYRALPEDPPAHIRTSLAVEPGAAAEWLPQESILFESCALDRTLHVELAADAWFLGVESLVFGRALMGERVANCRLHDRIRIDRAGQPLLHDAIRLHGPADALARPAIAAGAGALATLVLVAPDADSRLAPLRAAWKNNDAGASAWNGMLLARVTAADGAALREAVLAALACLRGPRPLPRVWMC
ncbi:MAG: hypothetical protein BGP12_04175 [Rhodospirillales bacterium 70-18]|nr:MAG: hypothetical protein BGP12_04175 [Rhodospirillales bacterium 70-18]